MEKKNKKVELLAPVGSMESLHAAVQNGAQAVYLGGKLFSARQYASNFDLEELKVAVRYAHLRGVKVYVTANILLRDDEIEEVVDYIKSLYEIDIDALIVQDIGLASLVKSIFPEFEIHGSTQMTINNLEGTIFLENMGFQRVVLARELSIEEIRYINERSNIELEAFVHGALCVCYSGQCLMSSIIGGRSGNRGRCAQPCRMSYSIISLKDENYSIKDYERKYILSPKDLNTIENLEEIIESGILSLKIEGRMKKPEYVATVVNKYRKSLDLGSNKISETDKREIEEIFNRGFTKGYLFGDFGDRLISLDKPNNRGICIGKVVKIDRNKICIRLKEDVQVKDGIQLVTNKGEEVGLVLDNSARKGTILKIDKIKGVDINSLVYRTSNNLLLEKAKESFENIENIKYPIDIDVFISIGKIPVLIIRDGEHTIKVEGSELVEKAKKVSLTEERVKNQLDKLTNEPYYIDNIKIFLDENSFLPLSELNSLRRRGIELLNEKKAVFNSREKIPDTVFKSRVRNYFGFEKREKVQIQNRKLSVKVSNIEQFQKLDLEKLDRIYIGFNEDLLNCAKEVSNKGKEVYIDTGKILSELELKNLEEKIERAIDYIDGVSVSNLGTFQFVKDKFDLNIHGDIGLNVFNSFTSRALWNMGASSISLSPELNLKQIEEICKKGNIAYETIGYGYLPTMVTKHCPMSLIKKCNNNLNCNECSFREGYGLKDRKNKIFAFTRKDKITTIYNSVPLMVLEELEEIYNSGINMMRLDFSFEREGIETIQKAFYDYINGNLGKKEIEEITDYCKEKTGITRGHYFRGVL